MSFGPRTPAAPTAGSTDDYRRNGSLTITHTDKQVIKDTSALALAALGWVLAEERRAHRFLDLTGLTPDTLRAAIGEPATHRAVFEFLAAHEPDMLGAAEALEVSPEELARAGREMGA